MSISKKSRRFSDYGLADCILQVGCIGVLHGDGLVHSPVADEDRELHRPLLVEDCGLEEARRGW